ncbi:MAG: hypothetical protein BMS9Abin13_011 [Patescibacteria group bacterium]|nr:MAG: hypothetical protein BMS9Abin13_011 [Patescibacteria group bacterium]
MLSENGTPERVAEILNDALAHLDKLKPKRREAFCLLFGNVSIQGIADIVNETWLDPDYELLLDADDVLIAAKKK